MFMNFHPVSYQHVYVVWTLNIHIAYLYEGKFLGVKDRFLFCISTGDRIQESYRVSMWLVKTQKSSSIGRNQVVGQKSKTYSISLCTYCGGTLNCKILSTAKMVLVSLLTQIHKNLALPNFLLCTKVSRLNGPSVTNRVKLCNTIWKQFLL